MSALTLLLPRVHRPLTEQSLLPPFSLPSFQGRGIPMPTLSLHGIGGIEWKSICGFPPVFRERLQVNLERFGISPRFDTIAKAWGEAVEYAVSDRHDLDIRSPQFEPKGRSAAVIDNRSSIGWRTGRSPTAVHTLWNDFHAGRERRPLGREALRRILADHGVDPSSPLCITALQGSDPHTPGGCTCSQAIRRHETTWAACPTGKNMARGNHPASDCSNPEDGSLASIRQPGRGVLHP